MQIQNQMNDFFFFENQDPFMRRMEGSMIVRHNPCEPNPDMPPSQDELENMVHKINKIFFLFFSYLSLLLE